MHISRIVIRNFRNFEHLDLTIHPGVTCIVGENNSGKTNFLRAIRLPIDATLSSTRRSLSRSDFYCRCDFKTPQQVLVSLEFRDFAGKENEEAMAMPWTIGDDIARITYRFRPTSIVVDAIEAGEIDGAQLTMEDYRWQIVGAGGNVDPATVEWNEEFGRSISFSDLQQFLVTILHPLRDVEQSLRQSRFSPLIKILDGSSIPETEKDELIKALKKANKDIASSETISGIGDNIEQSFSEAAGEAFKMNVDLGMATPSFDDISRNLKVLLTNKSLTMFDPTLNGLGLNNVLYISMLLRFFEDRIDAGKTPGQLLLFEEPEAHLHPQLQRVVFSALLQKSFQTFVTTHSTHITSQIPLNSTVVLSQGKTPAVDSCTPATTTDLDPTQIADLERYLDATRGTLLYAKRVMLVEGPAELFLIPPLVKHVMDIDLEAHGITVIPIYGIHFKTYAPLFCDTGIRKKCAIIADADLTPSDSAYSEADDIDLLPVPDVPDLEELENEFVKVFACSTTFERAMTTAGTLKMFAAACKDFNAKKATKRLSEITKDYQKNKKEAKDLVLKAAKRFGKARFAQVSSKYVYLANEVPKYISTAINWLLKDDTE